MTSTEKKHRPANSRSSWNFLTIALFLLWMVVAVGGNWPITSPTFEISRDQYELTLTSGLPFWYLETHVGGPGSTTSFRFHPWLLIANIVLIIINQASVVFAVKFWMHRFSIRHLFVLTFLVALMVMVGQSLASAQIIMPLIVFLMALYFLPTIAAITGWIYRRLAG